MDLAWNPWAIPSMLVVVGAWSMAGLVFLTRPDRTPNRLLATYLFLEGLAFLWLSVGGLVAGSPQTAFAARRVGYPVWTGVLVFYLLFLSTLNTPLVRPLRWWFVRVVLFMCAAAVAMAAFLWPRLWYEEDLVPWYGGYGTGAPLVLNGALFAAALCISLFALVAAVSALVRTPEGTALRSQAAFFVAAFGVRDVAMVVFAAAVFGGRGFGVSVFSAWDLAVLFVWPLGVLGLHVLLALGILRTQLFDIDLKIKWTVRRGTVVAALAAVFFVVKEGIEAVLPVEGVLPSIAAAAAIGLLALPAWWAAGRLADRLLPGVEDTEEYRRVRRREVYRAAVESAFADGVVSAKERDVLATLAHALGVTRADVRAIERDAAAVA